MQVNLNIEATIAASLEAALAPDRLRQLIEKQVTEVADRAIKDVFSTYGKFSETVKEALTTVVPHEISMDGAASWNHAIGQHIRERLAAVNQERIAQAMAPMLDELLEQPPKTIKVSELVAKAVEAWSDHYGTPRYGRPTVIVEHSDGSTSGYWSLALDPEGDQSRYSCKVFLQVKPDGGVFGLRVDSQDVKNMKFAGPFYNFEAFLFHLYTGGTRLVLDTEDFGDVYYPESDE